MKNRYPLIKRLHDLPLGWKFSSVVCGVVLMMGVVSILFIESRLSNAIHAEHQERGLTIARNLAADCVDLLLTDNRIKLHQLLSNIKATEKDVEYLFVLDSQKNIFAHTFGAKGFPKVLLDANPLHGGAQFSHAHLLFDGDENIISELAVLSMDGEAGEIHLGLSEAFIRQKIKDLRQELVAITSLVCLLGILAALFFARIINKPLKSLAIASDKVGQGELIHDLPIVAHDEIGRLTATFNQMVSNIEESQVRQKDVEERLASSYALLDSLINSIPDLIFYKDNKSIYLGCNDAFATFAGRDKEDIAGNSDFDFFERQAAEFFREKDRQMLASGMPQRNEEWVDYPDGRRVLLDTLKTPYNGPDGNVLGVIGVSRDITERKEAEEALRLSKEEWEKTFDAIPDIITLQDKNMEIIRGNKAARDFFEMESQGFIGKKCHAIFRDISEPCPGCPKFGTLQDKLPHAEIIEHEKLQKTFHVATAPILDQNNEVQYLAHIARDITAQKKLEEELFQAHKMEAIGTLAGGVAHDFNNLLTAIMGHSELAKLNIPEECEAEKNLDEVLKASKRAAALVQQILSFSRKSGKQLQAVSPHLMVKEAVKMLRSSLPATITIQENIDGECGQVLADSTNLYQVVVNLCTNALHAMKDEKGLLTIRLSRQEIGAEEVVGEAGVNPGTFIVLSVNDTGCGIDEASRERIFDPYFTTKEAGKGTGLGLSVVHGIIKEYNGFIKVESEVGTGTSFHVYMPALEEELASPEETEHEESLSPGTERILVVDDESMIAFMHQEALASLGYSVSATTDSVEALAAIRANPDQFDLIITDQTMPGLTGAELAQEILAIAPVMPIILCTGYSSVLSEEEALAVGIKKYVQKPVALNELVQVVRSVLDENGGQ
ncbi:MAG: PAS domain-containing protein [Thermodesulfobacteriota bacterium]